MELLKKVLWGAIRLPRWYSASAKHRDEKLWAFGAWDGLRYSDNSRALFEYVVSNCPDIKAFWISKSETVFNQLKSKGLPVVMSNTSEGDAVMRRVGYFFLTKGPLDGDPTLMRGCIVVWLWHGMPLKQIGNDAMMFVRKNTFWKRMKTAIRRIIVPWEFLEGDTISCAPFFTPFMMSAFGLTKERVWETGYPRNDYLFNTDKTESLIASLHKNFDRLNRPAKLLLYMPTHRDAVTRSGRVFDPFSMAGFNLSSIEEVLEQENIVLLYKGHFYDSVNEGLKTSKRILTITDDSYDNLYTFVKDVDILMTDYSSIYFDFLLCRKPIVLFPFDMQEYINYSRPFYFDYHLMNGYLAMSWQEVSDCLSRSLYYEPSEETVSRFNLYLDGNSSERIVKHLQACLKS